MLSVASAGSIGQANTIPPPTVWEATAILVAVPLGQFTHELAHFAVAYALRAKPILHLRIRERMSVSYDEHSIGTKAAVGLAPTYTGVLAAAGYVLFVGWPAPSYWLVAVGLALAFHCLPSQEDLKGLGALIGLDEPMEDWERTVWKAMLGVLVGSWAAALPYPNGLVFYLLILPINAASISLFILGVREYDHAQHHSLLSSK